MYYRLWTIASFGFALWLWGGLLMTLFNAFYASVLWLLFGMLCLLLIQGVMHTKILQTLRTMRILLPIGILFFSIIVAFSADPSVFSGRDQGSYAGAAIHLAEEQKLTFDTPASSAFFAIYGPGKALNFPGFDYTDSGQLTSQFPLGTIAWFASLFALFGLSGFAIANTLTLFLFLVSFFLLLRLFVTRYQALWGLAIAVTSLPSLWFVKFTLSENIALALFVLLSLQLVLVFRYERTLSIITSLTIAAIFPFIRIEGLAFLGITILLLAYSQPARSIWRSRPLLYGALPFLAFCLIFARHFILDIPFYKAITKAALDKWYTNSSSSLCIEPDCAVDTTASLWSILHLYGLTSLIIIGIVSIAILVKRRAFHALIPITLALPTFVYFLSPSISADHPWMLRRFVFSIYPSLLFSSIVGITIVQHFLTQLATSRFHFFKRHYATLLFILLFASQIPFAIRYGTYAENKELLAQTKILSQSFSERDLVMIDRLTTGDGWAMLPEPLALFGARNAVYVFNPNDLDRLSFENFEHIYLVVGENEASQYTDHTYATPLTFSPIKTSGLTTSRLEQLSQSRFPNIIPSYTRAILYRITR